MSVTEFLRDLTVLRPLVILVAWACALLLVDLFLSPRRKRLGAGGSSGLTPLLAALGLVVVLVFTLLQAATLTVGGQSAFNGMIHVDGFAIYLNTLVLASGLAGIALAYDYLRRTKLERGEYYVLLLFSIAGMMLMTMAADLIMVFLALELLSIPLYVLAGFAVPRPASKTQVHSEEAALKYFLMGVFATGFIVYGVALTFGATATTSLAGIVAAVEGGTANTAGLLIGAALLLVGLGFKIAAVPFHMWTPDVYQGAPTAVTGFMAVGAKAAGFAALMRVFFLAYPGLADDLAPVVWGLSALTMILGNVVAIAQVNIKRLLAYSSIAHAGYILMALVPFGQADVAQNSVAAALFYLLAYALTSFCAWAVVISLEKNEGKGVHLEDYAGLGKSHPWLAAAMTVAMLSLTGIPPTLGFFGKFYLFRPVIEGGYIGLAIIGVLTSLVSAYYYLRVVVFMYMRTGEPEVHREFWLALTAFGAAAATLLLGIFAQPLFAWAVQALLGL